MLGKLIKYEFKSTAKWFLPLYAFTLIMAPLTRLLISSPIFENSYLHGISTLFATLYGLSIFAIAVITFFLIVFRFYKSMATEEGYLTHTLPVTPTTLITSKLISSVLWTILAVIVAVLSLVILFFQPTDFQLLIHAFSSDMKLVMEEFQKQNISLTLLIIEIFVGMILGLCYYILKVYAAIAIGQLFNVQKLLASFAAYFILGFVPQVLMLISFAIPFLSNQKMFENPENIGDLVNFVMLFGIGFESILIAIYFFIANYIFKHKLNLE